MKRIILIFSVCLLFLFKTASSQQLTIQDQKTLGGSSQDWADCGVLCIEGLLICGRSSSGVSGDKTEPNRGVWDDYWILKLDNDLNLQWQKTIGGNNFDALMDAKQCDDGGFLLFGHSNSPISGDKTVPLYGMVDWWLVKTDSSGMINWQKSYGGDKEDYASCMLNLGNGSFLLAGISDSDSSGVKSQDSRGGDDFWVICIDSAGEIIWDRTYGGAGIDGALGMVMTEDHNIVIMGGSSSPVSGEKSEPCYGWADIWLIKIDISGNIIWDRTFGGDDLENQGGITAVGRSVYACSYSASGVSGVKTEPCIGGWDTWLIKVDEDGNLIWDRTIGGTDSEVPNAITSTYDNRLVIAMESGSGISGNKTEACYGLTDYWIVVTDTNGTIQLQKTIGGDDNDSPTGLITGDNGELVCVGYSYSGISGLKTDASRGDADYWIISLQGLQNTEMVSQDGFSMAPNPATNLVTLSSGTSANSYFEVIDLLGRQIINKTFFTGNYLFNVEDFKDGIYIVKCCLDGKNIIAQKLIVTKN